MHFRIRMALVVLGILLLLQLVWVTREAVGDAENGRTTFTLGLPFSPWFRYEESRSKTEFGDGPVKSDSTSMNFNHGIEFLSWSSLCVVLAVVCFQVAKWVKRRQPFVPPQPTGPPLRRVED